MSITLPTTAAPTPLPPGPKAWPLGLPLLRAMRRDYLGFATGLQRDHGDLVAMRIAHERSVDLFHPDLVRQVLVDQSDKLVRWERGVEVFSEVFGQSVLTTEGATWQRQRRMLMPAFTPRRVAGYAGLLQQACADALDGALPANADEAEADLEALWSQLAIGAILRLLFSLHDARAASAAMQATRVLSETAMAEMFRPFTLPDWLPLPGKAAKRGAIRTLRGLIGGQIAKRKEAGLTTHDDLLAHLLALRDEATGEGLSEREVFDQCLVSFQAGHETTATALTWWSALLMAHPAAAQRAQAEVDAVLGGACPGPDDLARLPWLQATLKEALRLYPPTTALMTRRCTAPLQVGPHLLPTGTLARVTIWALQRDARWFDAPEAFRPERFLPDAPPPPRGSYLPFGLGPRVCIGQHLAQLEMGIAAVMALQRLQLPDRSGQPLPTPEVNVTLRPAGGLRARLRRRKAGAGGGS
ncbi:MAG TPA: cytochrome P450 [Aquabacterium sp.]|nr:cytochrome P450 [Aquabacterium sp.]